MSTAACANHGSEGVCARCGAFVCPACRGYLAERAHCRECIDRVGRKPSLRATGALALATLGLCTGAPGALALALGLLELRAIRAAEAPPAGRSFAELAIGLGALELVATAALIARWALS